MDRGALDMRWMVGRILASSYRGAISVEYIEDCGGIQEGYDVRDEVETLVRFLLEQGLALCPTAHAWRPQARTREHHAWCGPARGARRRCARYQAISV